MSKQKFSIKKRIQSFKYAFQGLKTLLKAEHNSRIHLLAAVLAIAAGFYLEISRAEWMALVLTIALVLICEIFNTAIEKMADFVSPEIHPQIKKIKDLAAAAVLISALASVLVGLLIFIPRLPF